MKTDNPTTQTDDSVKSRVFSAIDDRSVTPKSRFLFLCQHTWVWLLWLLTVVFGALATAVLLFTSTHRYYDLYEAMHDNFVTFFLEALPVLWILTLIILIGVAAWRLRATNRGYRYSTVWVAGSSLLASLVLGFAFNALGFGFAFDKALGEVAPMYYSMAEREEELWLRPEQGRLVGVYKADIADVEQQIVFVDVTGAQWSIYIGELFPKDQELLRTGAKVRLLGAPTELDSFRYYHACGVFPWLMDKKRAMRELSAERRAFVEKIYGHKDMAKARLQALEEEAFGNASADNEPSMRVCAEIAAVKRIGAHMR